MLTLFQLITIFNAGKDALKARAKQAKGPLQTDSQLKEIVVEILRLLDANLEDCFQNMSRDNFLAQFVSIVQLPPNLTYEPDFSLRSYSSHGKAGHKTVRNRNFKNIGGFKLTKRHTANFSKEEENQLSHRYKSKKSGVLESSKRGTDASTGDNPQSLQSSRTIAHREMLRFDSQMMISQNSRTCRTAKDCNLAKLEFF
jgi:hypothetical protein